MALNSFITAEGLEMGRAQVMQAEAATRKGCSAPLDIAVIRLPRNFQLHGF